MSTKETSLGQSQEGQDGQKPSMIEHQQENLFASTLLTLGAGKSSAE
jgi:hypothetical protein